MAKPSIRNELGHPTGDSPAMMQLLIRESIALDSMYIIVPSKARIGFWHFWECRRFASRTTKTWSSTSGLDQ